MHGIADLQRALRAWVVEGVASPGLLALGPGHFDERLRTYQHAYVARLRGALRENYPALAAALGDQAFAELAAAYLAATPSRTPSIRWFGGELADFCAAHPALVGHPALAELARMEWAMRSVFDAADGQPLLASQLQNLAPSAWPGLRFALKPGVLWLDLCWAVEPVWQSLSRDPLASVEAPQAEAHRLLIWRQGLATRWRTLEPDEASLLAAAASATRFDALCQIAAGLAAEPAQRVAGLLRRWVDEGLLGQQLLPS